MKITKIKYSPERLQAKQDGIKTVTRRPIKPQPINLPEDSYEMRKDPIYNRYVFGFSGCDMIGFLQSAYGYINNELSSIIKKYGTIGDILICEDGTKDEILGIKVRRLQDMTKEDAILEGLRKTITQIDKTMWTYNGCGHFQNPVVAFRCVWDDIYRGSDFSWDKNPWVVIIEFKPLDRKT